MHGEVLGILGESDGKYIDVVKKVWRDKISNLEKSVIWVVRTRFGFLAQMINELRSNTMNL